MTTLPPIPDPRRSISRLALRLAAFACFAAAAWIVIAAGLPDRADATAFTLDNGRAVAPEIGAIAPPLRLAAVDGETVALDDLRGRVVVLNFWATWCVPCRVEMPALQTLAERYPDGLTVLGVNASESPAAVRIWRAQFALTFPLLLDPDGAAARDYRLRGQPTTVILAPDGHIRAIFYGPADVAALEQSVAALLTVSTERISP